MQRPLANAWWTDRADPGIATLVGLALALALLSVTPPLGAQPSSDSQQVDARLRTIRVVLVGGASPSAFGERLRAWFTPETRVTVQQAPRVDPQRILGPKEEGGVFIWIEVRSRATARIYFVVSGEGPAQRFLMRDVALENGLDELGQERLTQVVYSSVLALWQGQVESPQSDVERQLSSTPVRVADKPQPPSSSPSRPSAPPASVPRRSRGSLSFAALVGYGLSARGREGLAHGPELRAALSSSSGKTRLGGYWSGRYLLPVQTAAEGVTLRLTGGRLCLGALLEREVSQAFRVQVGAGLGGDVVQYGVVEISPALDRVSGNTEIRPIGSFFAGARFLAGRRTIALLGQLEVQLQRNHYDVHPVAGPDRAIIVPWRLQPGLSLMMGFDAP